MMKKRLYISDLDGTLLNRDKEVPPVAVDILNTLLDADKLHFSVATARTPATVENILMSTHIEEQIVVMNGAALYDLKSHVYTEINVIPKSSIDEILMCCREEIEGGFLYTINDNKLEVYYNDLSRPERLAFFEERQNLKYKKFIEGKPQKVEEIIYFVFIDTEEKIREISKKIEGVPHIAQVLYKDIYSDEGWILEVYSDKATKANGVRRLKELSGYDEVIAFGDNYNDLPMFSVADRSYAVENAVGEVKHKADGVIGPAEEGSVVRFIEKEIGAIE